jgi:hypothetical protein
MNRKKAAGTSNPPSKSTVSDKAYAEMKAGFPNSKKNKAAAKAKSQPRLSKSMGYS